MENTLQWFQLIGYILTSATAIFALILSFYTIKRSEKVNLQKQRSRLWGKHNNLKSTVKLFLKVISSKIDYEEKKPLMISDLSILAKADYKNLKTSHDIFLDEFHNCFGIFPDSIMEYFSDNLFYSLLFLDYHAESYDKHLENNIKKNYEKMINYYFYDIENENIYKLMKLVKLDKGSFKIPKKNLDKKQKNRKK